MTAAAPWIVALVGGCFGFIWGVQPYDDGCASELAGGLREGSTYELDSGIFIERCTATGPGGTVHEATQVYWFTWAIVIAVAVGGWFAGAGLMRRVPPRRALLGIGAAFAAFLVANALFFTGLVDTGWSSDDPTIEGNTPL